MEKIAIVGAGNVGKVLGYALKNKGYKLSGAFARTEKSRETVAQLLCCPVYSEPEKAVIGADIIFITTPDRVIKEICDYLAQRNSFIKGQIVLHTSGAHSSQILLSARRQGALILSLHPLQTFPEFERGLRSLPGTYFTAEGDEEAFPAARQMVQALEGEILSIPTEMKPLYHAAACVACNYLTTLMDAALKMFSFMGIPPDKAFKSLSPLIYSTLNNIGELGTEKALTGPIARGDISTINSHLEILKEKAEEFLPLYRQLGLYTVSLAARKGTLQKEQQNQLKILLEGKENE